MSERRGIHSRVNDGSIINPFKEFCYKRKQRKEGGVSRREMWGQRRVLFKMENIAACVYADGNDPERRRKY